MLGRFARRTVPARYGWLLALFAFLILGTGLTLSSRGVDIFGLVASATSSLTRSPVTLYMTPYDDKALEVGASKKIDLVVNAREPINALGTTITYPQESVEILGFSKEKSFLNLWTEETSIREDSGEIHFSGGTTMRGGLTGTGTILTIAVRAKKIGHVELRFKDSEIYSGDGTGTRLDSSARVLAFDVVETPRTVEIVSGGSSQVVLEPEKLLPRTPDVNTDGAINLIDVSILMMRLVMPYDYHFDLDMDGAITVGDVSVVLSKIR